MYTAQTISLDATATGRGRLRGAVLAFVMMLALLFASVPARAYADGYEMPRVDIAAVVRPDGSIRVTERRTFEFDDDVNGVFLEIPAGENQQGDQTSLSVAGVSVVRGDAEPQVFRSVDYASSGDEGVYTVESTASGDRIKVFAPSYDGDTVTIGVEYVMTGAVMAWSDTAELYWKFVGPEWAEASRDVHLTVSFQGAASSSDAPAVGESFRAWAHGPLDGTVSLNADDASSPIVTFEVPEVAPGEFAEARIAFPASWVPSLVASADARLDAILSEEQAWADEANARRERARTMVLASSVAQLAVPTVLLAVALWGKFAKYRNPDPVFRETYFRDVPSADHPAVLSAFMSGGSVEDRAFIATLMKLTDDGVVSLRPETQEKRRLFGTKEVEVYMLTLLDRARATDPIDRGALALYFGERAHDGDAVPIDSLPDAVGDEDDEGPLEEFKASVMAALEERNLSSTVPTAYTAGMFAAAVVFGVISVFLAVFLDFANVLVLIASLAMCAAAALVVGTTKCYPLEAIELKSRCDGLKRWLEDFTNLDEAAPSDLILWNKLLVLAVAFGVSDEVLHRLADAVPQDLRGTEDMGYCYPVYWWCYPHGRLGSPTGATGGAYRESVAQLASSSDSSGGGFGGGFSGGGGGGVGGGGGGTF